MKIQCFSIIAGSAACNAKCPYCVSKMTGVKEIGLKEPKVNWRNFEKACRFAQINSVSNVIITGKGEPTLFPKQVTKFLKKMEKYNFPIIELQTNGLLLAKKEYINYLKEWYDLGLTVISISIVHHDKQKNRQIFVPGKEYIDLRGLIEKLHKIGYSVRLNCTMIRGFIDSAEEVNAIIEKTREWGAEQLSLREVAKPLESENKEVYEWTCKNIPKERQYNLIKKFIEEKGRKLLELAHGAIVYDVNGQNVCLTNALTIKPDEEDMRQIIFFPDGHLKFDWQFRGAILI